MGYDISTFIQEKSSKVDTFGKGMTHYINLKLLHTRMLCAKLDPYWVADLVDVKVKIF